MAPSGALAIGAAGGLLLALTLIDLFVTVFNYDGFDFIANRMHGALWRVLRGATTPFPAKLRHAALSLGSAAMLPATYVLWIGLEVVAFAMIFDPGIVGGSFSVKHVPREIGSAFYLSGGDLSSLTFGDVVPRSGLFRALVDLETIVGLTTFTLALGYVVTTFGVLRRLDSLHATVRRHAENPDHPSSILARHFQGGQPTELPSVLQALADKLEDYDQGLRRYPVVYYFHTRRLDRSIPRVFARLGELIALLRWGLPYERELTRDPFLDALRDEYVATLTRLQRRFVGPPELHTPEPVTADEFQTSSDRADADEWVERFRDLQRRARTCAGVEQAPDRDARNEYDQYREWLPFAYRKRILIGRIADGLGYEHS